MKNPGQVPGVNTPNKIGELSSGRYYFLDTCRTILMLVGIPYHFSLLYMPPTWSTSDPGVFTPFSIVLAINHSFRMSCFFLITGFFSFVLIKRSLFPLQWLERRMYRLGVPFITGFAFINLPQILYKKEEQDSAQWTNLSNYKKLNEIIGPSIGHLWFLIVLMILSVVFTFTYIVFKRRAATFTINSSLLTKLTDSLTGKYGLILFAAMASVFGLCYNGIIYLGEHIFPFFNRYDGLFFILIWGPLKYLPVFICGILNAFSPIFFQIFLKFSWLNLLLAIVCIAIYVVTSIIEASLYIKILRVVFWNCSGIFASSILLSVLYKFFNYKSDIVKIICDSSLVMYIIHPLIIQILFSWCQGYIKNRYFEFITGCLIVYIICFLFYLLIQRSKLLKYIFSGK